MRLNTVSLLLMCLLSAGLRAEDPTEGSAEEPDIQIRYGKEETSYEYRINGELVEIKIVPKIGPVYYLVPSDGGDWERSDKSRIMIPSWKILEW